MSGRLARMTGAAGRHPGGVLVCSVCTVCAVLLAGALAGFGRPAGEGDRDRITHASAARGAQTREDARSPVPTFRSVRTYPAVAEPVRLRIPSIGVETDLQHLGLAADGTIAAPTEWQTAGWYDRGPRPGQPGPAVIVGHVDSRTGPAVFHRLSQLRPGARVLVDLANGTTARFTVTGHQQVAKSQFPTDLVYSPTLERVLRLVTCGGTFDAGTGHYRDNIIVTAVATS
jgi:sortase (surface protein transpeptidase)